jgi:hypothetical protein
MSIRKFSVIMALIACFPGSHLPLAAAIADNVAVGSTDQTKIIPTIQIIQPKQALNASGCLIFLQFMVREIEERYFGNRSYAVYFNVTMLFNIVISLNNIVILKYGKTK